MPNFNRLFLLWSYWIQRIFFYLLDVKSRFRVASSVRPLLPDFRGSGASYGPVQIASLCDVARWLGWNDVQLPTTQILDGNLPSCNSKGIKMINLISKFRISPLTMNKSAYKYGYSTLFLCTPHPTNFSLTGFMHNHQQNVSEVSPGMEVSQEKKKKAMEKGKDEVSIQNIINEDLNAEQTHLFSLDADLGDNATLANKDITYEQGIPKICTEMNENEGEDVSIMHLINEIDQQMEVDTNEDHTNVQAVHTLLASNTICSDQLDGKNGTAPQATTPISENMGNIELDANKLPLGDAFEEDEEDQDDYEYDDLLAEELNENTNLSLIPPMTKALMEPIIDSKLPAFTEQDLEDFLNEKPKLGLPATSESSYHSLQNSMVSSSSFVLKMGNLGMQLQQPSSSTSGKRKTTDGIDDTASSSSMSAKKAKK